MLTTNPTCPDLGLNPGHQSKKRTATNPLSYGTARYGLVKVKVKVKVKWSLSTPLQRIGGIDVQGYSFLTSRLI
jgi:hypothetical protein